MLRLKALACLTALALGVLAVAPAAPGFEPTREPVSPNGTRATIDLPASQHMKNVGGSDGSGLCVFTSVQHAAYWQNVRELDGFRAWMQRRPGGGWPEKLDQMFTQFCREKGVSVPAYIQHTGGDESFLELALKTDRMPAVTYAGRDDFYNGRIAHMVNLAHLDASRAAIIDNNRPGVWVWMTRAEFLSRWRDMQGGWAVVLLADPPPPIPEAMTRAEFLSLWRGTQGGWAVDLLAAPCVCGNNCSCKPGECPGKCPVVFGQCPGGRCPLPSAPTVSPAPVADSNPIGNPPTDRHEWRQFADGAWGWRFKEEPAKVEAAGVENHGVDPSKIHAHPHYSINGSPCTKEQAERILVGADGLKDDSDRWHLTAVGDAALLAQFKADVAQLPTETRAKLLVQTYGPDAWTVNAYRLPAGVSLRRPSPGRTAADVGAIPPGSYTAAKLTDLLSLPTGPTPKPPAPAPAPGPDVQPAPPPPAPKPSSGSLGWLIAIVLAVVLLARK